MTRSPAGSRSAPSIAWAAWQPMLADGRFQRCDSRAQGALGVCIQISVQISDISGRRSQIIDDMSPARGASTVGVPAERTRHAEGRRDGQVRLEANPTAVAAVGVAGADGDFANRALGAEIAANAELPGRAAVAAHAVGRRCRAIWAAPALPGVRQKLGNMGAGVNCAAVLEGDAIDAIGRESTGGAGFAGAAVAVRSTPAIATL